MNEISTIGMDTAKSVFQLHGIDEKGDCKLLRRWKRREVLAFFKKARWRLRRVGHRITGAARSKPLGTR